MTIPSETISTTGADALLEPTYYDPIWERNVPAERRSAAILLLVEDSPSEVALIRRALKKIQIPYPLLVVGDGQEAIEYLSGMGKYVRPATKPVPALILLDLHMPRKHGFEVLKWIRQQADLATVPVVVLSNSDCPHDIDCAASLGANSFVQKPIYFTEFQKVLSQIINYWLEINASANTRRRKNDAFESGPCCAGPRPQPTTEDGLLPK